MPSKDLPDPLTEWFRRNRGWLLLAVWLVMLVDVIDDLMTDGVNGAIRFFHRAIYLGLLFWFLGSRRDKDQPEFWRRFIAGWAALFVAEAALVIIAAARGNFDPLTLATMVFTALMFGFCVVAYRRIQRGLTWNRQPSRM